MLVVLVVLAVLVLVVLVLVVLVLVVLVLVALVTEVAPCVLSSRLLCLSGRIPWVAGTGEA